MLYVRIQYSFIRTRSLSFMSVGRLARTGWMLLLIIINSSENWPILCNFNVTSVWCIFCARTKDERVEQSEGDYDAGGGSQGLKFEPDKKKCNLSTIHC